MFYAGKRRRTQVYHRGPTVPVCISPTVLDALIKADDSRPIDDVRRDDDTMMGRK